VQAKLDSVYGKNPPDYLRFQAGTPGAADPEQEQFVQTALGHLNQALQKTGETLVPVWHQDSKSTELWRVAADGSVRDPVLHIGRRKDGQIRIQGTSGMTRVGKTLPPGADPKEIASVAARIVLPRGYSEDWRSFCQEGRNKGMPGPCPKGEYEAAPAGPTSGPGGRFAIGQMLHPKADLVRPVASLPTVSEGFARAGAPVTVTAVHPNGMVQVQNQAGEKFTFAPGQFRQWGQPGQPGGPPAPAPPREPRLPRATAEEALDHINRVKADLTPANVAAVAGTLSRMTKKDVHALKRSLGIRAGGVKSALVQKVAHEATRRLSIREQHVREARKLGYTARDLDVTARQQRQTYNDLADQTTRLLSDARRQYTQLTDGGRLSRGMTAFRTGDYTQIPHFDQIAESLQRSYPELLPGDAQEGYERLYTMLAAGPPARMSYQQSLGNAVDELKAYGPRERQPRRARPVEEELPFAETTPVPASDPEHLFAILAAMIDHAGNPEMLDLLADLAHEGPEALATPDEDETPPDPAAQAKVADWLNEAARRKRSG